jgi:nicotinamidase/pyrazinamidase
MNIFYDVDTQHDFMDKTGALYVPKAELLKPKLRKITNYARIHQIPLLGSVDRHFGTEEYKSRESELKKWGGPFGNHCMAGTEGERKVSETFMYSEPIYDREDFPIEEHSPIGMYARFIPHLSESMSVHDQLLWSHGVQEAQLMGYLDSIRKAIDPLFDEKRKYIPTYFEKQANDVFTNPVAEFILKKIRVQQAVVYGVATDYCVKDAVLGMQKRGIQCYVVTDAVAEITKETGKSALEAMIAAGAKLVKTDEVLQNQMRW